MVRRVCSDERALDQQGKPAPTHSVTLQNVWSACWGHHPWHLHTGHRQTVGIVNVFSPALENPQCQQELTAPSPRPCMGDQNRWGTQHLPGRWLGGWGATGGWGPVTSCRKRLGTQKDQPRVLGKPPPGPHQPGPLLEPPGGRGFPDEQASTSFTITQVLQTTVTNDEHRALHRFLRGFWSEARSRVCRKWNTHLVYSLGITLSLFQNLWSGCACLHLTKYFLVSGPCESRFFTLDMKYLKQ